MHEQLPAPLSCPACEGTPCVRLESYGDRDIARGVPCVCPECNGRNRVMCDGCCEDATTRLGDEVWCDACAAEVRELVDQLEASARMYAAVKRGVREVMGK